MRRFILAAFLGFVPVAGCQQPQMQMDSMEKPTPGPELAKLQRFIGTWTGTAEMIQPSPEEMKKMMPEGAEMPASFAGGYTATWTLGGFFLRQDGWHDSGNGEKANYVELITWDPHAGKYHSWFFSDWGEAGEGWMTCDAEGKTWRIKSCGSSPAGPSTGEGSMTFDDDNTVEWCWSESGARGHMKLKGTSKKQG